MFDEQTLFAADPRRGGIAQARALAREQLLCRMFGDQVGPTQIGRYVLKERIGRGASGTVYAAFDPQLDRQVAVKVLRGLDDDDTAQDRVLREARTLAKLNHQNVVHVYEAGVDEDALYIAMEIVQGGTLRDWQLAEPRTWEETVRKYLAAGRGLAAAHRSGLVHRDFKPDNVLVGDDGEVKVIDFGLARGEWPSTPVTVEAIEGASSGSGAPTQVGAVAGTPPYMSPEQYLGQELDGRADQFSFCVSLHEALYGMRPFEADSIAALALKITKGTREPVRDRAVPAWLTDIVSRGLSPRASDRFVDMDALLAALATDPHRRRKRLLLGGAVAGALAGAVALGRVFGPSGTALEACPSAQPRVDEVWASTARARVEKRFIGSELPFAAQTWKRVQPRLDDFANRWLEAHHDACAATHVRHEQSGALLDAKMQCLDHALLALDATVDALATADQAGIEHAVSAAFELPDLQRCADPHYVQARAQGPDLAPDHIASLSHQLATARAQQLTARFDRAAKSAHKALALAEAAGDERGRARVLALLGSIEVDTGDYEAAEQHLRDAHFAALEVEEHSSAALSATRLGYMFVAHRQRFEPAADWARHAAVAAEKAEDPRLQAGVLNLDGTVAAETSELDLAETKFRAAIERTEEAFGKGHPRTATLKANLANLVSGRGRFQDAAELARASATQIEDALGPDHPLAARPLLILGRCQSMLGDQVKAEQSLLRARALAEASYECPHPLLRLSHDYLGNVTRVADKLDESQAHLQNAVECARKDVEHRGGLASAIQSLALLLAQRGQHEAALSELRKALEIWESIEGSEDGHVIAGIHRDMGRVLLDMDEPHKAIVELDEAMRIFASDLEESPIMADLLGIRARAREAMGDAPAARADREQIAAIEAAHPGQMAH